MLVHNDSNCIQFMMAAFHDTNVLEGRLALRVDRKDLEDDRIRELQ